MYVSRYLYGQKIDTYLPTSLPLDLHMYVPRSLPVYLSDQIYSRVADHASTLSVPLLYQPEEYPSSSYLRVPLIELFEGLGTRPRVL